jgi:hypothetical protein
MAADAGQVVAITAQEGDHITLSVPLTGFPDGFQLQPGDQVFLVSGDKGPEARPLARAREVANAPDRRGRTLAVENQEFALQDATVYEQSPDDRHVVFTVPNERGRSEQVLSVRSPNADRSPKK